MIAPGGVAATPSQVPEAARPRTSPTAPTPPAAPVASPPTAPVPRPPAAAPPGRPAASPVTPAARPPAAAPAAVSPAAATDAGPVWPQPGADAEPLRPALRASTPPEDEEIGVDCHVCGTRLHARRRQIGQTVKCPDCHSPVLVKTPPVRKQAKPVEYEEAELFKLSEPVEVPSATYVPPKTLAEGSPVGAPPAAGTPAGAAGAPGGLTAMQAAARRLLEKARAEQEAEEAEARESSAERFTQGLFAFFADRRALVRLAILAVWFQLAVLLLQRITRIATPEGGSALLGETISLVATAVLAVVGLTFLYAAAACGLALVQDSSNGLLKIENWPGVNFLKWGRVHYIVSAAIAAALPGAALGIVLSLAGVGGTLLLTAAVSFVALFPPILVSMFESNSPLAPLSNEVWGGIPERPHPWSLTYLITGMFSVGGLIGFYVSLAGNFVAALVGAAAMVACMMVYFRAVGWLMRFLAGRDLQFPAN